jgi:hypothetical protein
MRTKTAYREKPVENIPPAAILAEAPAVVAEVRPETEAQPETEAEHKYAEQVTTADEAAAALKRQVEALRQSEALLKQAAQPQRPLTREDKLGLWRQQGIPENEYNFLVANPELIDNPAATAYCAREAEAQGHQRGSDEFLHATKQIFDKYQAELQAQAQQTEQPMQETPKFFQPPPPKPMRPPSVPVSAPVSRSIPNGGPRPEYQQDPTKVHLSVEEKEIARASNISEVEYARQRLRLEKEKRDGIRQ